MWLVALLLVGFPSSQEVLLVLVDSAGLEDGELEGSLVCDPYSGAKW